MKEETALLKAIRQNNDAMAKQIIELYGPQKLLPYESLLKCD
jgi:hypothetical protein